MIVPAHCREPFLDLVSPVPSQSSRAAGLVRSGTMAAMGRAGISPGAALSARPPCCEDPARAPRGVGRDWSLAGAGHAKAIGRPE